MPVIKKYENRRLYDTEASRYVNLEEVAKMVEDGVDVSVVDVKTSRDLTREILLQIVLEGGDSAAALPVGLLRRIIRTRGADTTAQMLREQLVLGFELLETQLEQSEVWMAGLYKPPVVAEPPGPTYGAFDELAPGTPAWRAPAEGQQELEDLRAELGRLEARLKR